MPTNQSSATALPVPSTAPEARIRPERASFRPAAIGRLTALVARLRAAIGLSGVVSLVAGLALTLVCTVWAIYLGVPHPVAIMAGYGMLVGSVCLCMALLVIQNFAAKKAPVTARQPNYAAWRIVSKLSVSDASRLWCDIEPGCPASQESIAWAQAMLDAIRRGELPVIPKPAVKQLPGTPERIGPNWHSEISRDALKAWARQHGHSPRFLG